MTGITMTAADAEKTLVRLATCVERAGKMATLKLLLDLGMRLDAKPGVEEIVKGAQE